MGRRSGTQLIVTETLRGIRDPSPSVRETRQTSVFKAKMQDPCEMWGDFRKKGRRDIKKIGGYLPFAIRNNSKAGHRGQNLATNIGALHDSEGKPGKMEMKTRDRRSRAS